MSEAVYNGWKIEIRAEDEDDCRKYYHDAYPPHDWDAQPTHMDLSPYDSDLDNCALVIALKFPTRETFNSIAPMNRFQLEILWQRTYGDLPLPTAERL